MILTFNNDYLALMSCVVGVLIDAVSICVEFGARMRNLALEPGHEQLIMQCATRELVIHEA